MNGLVKAKEVHFDEEYLHVYLEDGRIISTPLSWYGPLQRASIEDLKKYRLICHNIGIEWEELDYHLNVENMLYAQQKKAA